MRPALRVSSDPPNRSAFSSRSFSRLPPSTVLRMRVVFCAVLGVRLRGSIRWTPECIKSAAAQLLRMNHQRLRPKLRYRFRPDRTREYVFPACSHLKACRGLGRVAGSLVYSFVAGADLRAVRRVPSSGGRIRLPSQHGDRRADQRCTHGGNRIESLRLPLLHHSAFCFERELPCYLGRRGYAWQGRVGP